MPRINGIAHIQLTVTNMQRSIPFYEKLLHAMEMVTLIKDDTYFYCIGGRTGLAISPADSDQLRDFNQRAPGLHHVCFRARSREDVDVLYAVAMEAGARSVHVPEEGEWAPGYYSALFEDPDGIRLEVNYVPGKGHLEQQG